MKSLTKVHSDSWSINIQSVYTGAISSLLLIFPHEQISVKMKLFSVFCAVLASAVAGPSLGTVSVHYGSDVRQEAPVISYGPPASPPVMSYQPPPPPLRAPPAPVAYAPPPVVRSTVPPPVYSSYSSPPANPPVSYAPPAPASPSLPPISVLITAPANAPVVSYGPPPASPPVQAYGPPALPPASPPVQAYGPPALPPASPPVQSYAPPPVRIPPPASPPVQYYTPPPPPVRIPPPASPPVQSYAQPATPVRAPAPAYGGYAPAPAHPVDSYGGQRLPSDISSPSRHIPITSFQQEIREGAHHQTSFQTGHGIHHQETTQIRPNPNARGIPEDENFGKALIQKSGQISYQSPEGQTINLRYVADENGFRPEGSHLPTPPPIPADIQASLRLLPRLEEPSIPIISLPPSSPASHGGGGYGGYSSPPSNPPVEHKY